MNTTATPPPKDLVGFLDLYLVKQAPFQIPDGGREWIVKFGPWITVVLLILTLPILLFALGLGVIFIPFVRLVLIAAPLLMPACMVMMPLILIVVVLTLPDKSGLPRKRPQWERDYLARASEKNEPKDKRVCD